MSGTLYLCATPIGNLGDITLRVLETLRSVSLIAAEDTRNSLVLLSKYEIRTPLTSYHEHNAAAKGEILLGKLLAGEDIALITDAGTPAISDPGERLVKSCIEYNIPVTSLPGPAALITALTLSGFSTRRFVFEGFLSREKKERRETLAALQTEARTIILYEAPHRLLRTLTDLAEMLGDTREIALCRELTKKFETIEHTTLRDAIEEYTANDPRGEFVLVLEGASGDVLTNTAQEPFFASMTIPEHVTYYESAGHDRKEAMRLAAKDRGVSRREIYQACIAASFHDSEIAAPASGERSSIALPPASSSEVVTPSQSEGTEAVSVQPEGVGTDGAVSCKATSISLDDDTVQPR